MENITYISETLIMRLAHVADTPAHIWDCSRPKRLNKQSGLCTTRILIPNDGHIA
jgi:hypothetical protein